MRKRFILLIFCAIMLVGFAGKQSQDRTKYFKFSHQKHVQGAEMACSDCHAQAEESVKAEDRLLPEKDVCANFHELEEEDN